MTTHDVGLVAIHRIDLDYQLMNVIAHLLLFPVTLILQASHNF